MRLFTLGNGNSMDDYYDEEEPEEGYSHPMDSRDYSLDIRMQTRCRMKPRRKGRSLPIETGLTHRQRIK